MSRSSASTAAVRSGVSAERTAERTGTESSAAAAATDCLRPTAPGGLETSSTRSVAGSASRAASASRVASPPTASERSRPPTPSTCETPDAGRVEQAGDLLRTGAAGGDQPDRPGADDVGEAERDAGDDRRAAVGAHDQDAGVVRGLLERHLVLDRDAVGEDQHAAAGGDRVGGLGDGVLAGHARRSPAPGRRAAARRARRRWCAAGRRPRCRSSARGRRARRRRRRRRRPARRRRPPGRRSAAARARRGSSGARPMFGGELEVERRGHGDQDGA